MRFTDESYAYLLGLYLGDGTIVKHARAHRLRIFMDMKYLGIVAEAFRALKIAFPKHDVGIFRGHHGANCMVASVYHSHLPCVFPQDGPGRKHERPIRLEPWQQRIVDAEPWPLIRRLIQSDGCRYINPTGKYRYVSYDFCQVSDDIRGIFTEACDRVGVRYRDYGRSVRIYRRESVALLEEFVGPKR